MPTWASYLLLLVAGVTSAVLLYRNRRVLDALEPPQALRATRRWGLLIGGLWAGTLVLSLAIMPGGAPVESDELWLLLFIGFATGWVLGLYEHHWYRHRRHHPSVDRDS